MKFTIIRFLKSTFIRLRMHVFFAPFTGLFQQVIWMTRLSKWASEHRKIAYNDFPTRWNYLKRYELYQNILEKEGLDAPVNYLEFGVADGHSFNWWMTQNTQPQSRFYGFDTFTGLPENFGLYKKGTFHNLDHMPAIKDSRGEFLQGLFQDTLPGFLRNFQPDKKTIIMLDADLYTATLFVLGSLAPYLKKGDIIFFDEFVVPTHEFMAFRQFTEAWYFPLECIGAANNYYFTAFRVG
ncbi:MAG: macrocin O-methyltransferase [Bacteroidota bacterium]|nr:macrocin O-methyltransferase [Bacteroidota bacterium]